MIVSNALSAKEQNFFSSLTIPIEVCLHMASYLDTIKDLNSFFSVNQTLQDTKFSTSQESYPSLLAKRLSVNVPNGSTAPFELKCLKTIKLNGGVLFPYFASRIGPSRFDKIETISDSFIDFVWDKFKHDESSTHRCIEYLTDYANLIKTAAPIYRGTLPNKIQFIIFNCLVSSSRFDFCQKRSESVSIHEKEKPGEKFGLYISKYHSYTPEIDYFVKLAMGELCSSFQWATEDRKYFDSVVEFPLEDSDEEKCVQLRSTRDRQ